MHMLLDKIHLDQISDFVNTFLKQYILNNNLQNDAVLCTYIQVGIIFLLRDILCFYVSIIKYIF